MDKKYIVALELSGSQIKGSVASAEVSPYSSAPSIVAEAIVAEDKVNCVQYGRVQNIADAAKHTSYVLQKLENLEKFPGCVIESAYVAIQGRSFGSMHTVAELTLAQEAEITREALMRLFQEAAKHVPDDKKVVKVLPRKFYVDNQPVQKPEGSLGTKLKGEFTIVTCNPATRRNLEMLFNERLELPIKEYVVTPLAIANMVLAEEEKQLGCVLLDLGAQTTTISIYKDRALQYLATLPMGSSNITRDLANALKLTDEKAELAKCTHGNALLENDAASPESARINSYVGARVGEIVANIMAQIGYAGYQADDLTAGFVVTGRGSKLRNFTKYLESASKMKVRRANIPANIIVPDHSVAPADYVSLISILAHAAQDPDAENCLTFEQASSAQEGGINIDTIDNQPYQRSGYDPFDDHDKDDNTWTLDDEEEERRRSQKAREDARRREKEIQKSQKAAEKRQKEEDEKNKKKLEEEEKNKNKNKNKNKSSWVSDFSDRLTKMLTFDDDSDTNLDE